MNEDTSAHQTPSLAAIPARYVLPIWPVATPTGLEDELWMEIQRRAARYVSKRVPPDHFHTWASFCQAVFAASQPRNTQRVVERKGTLHQFLMVSQARIDETVEEVLDPERIKRFLVSPHITRLDPGGQKLAKIALNAAVAALLGEPRRAANSRDGHMSPVIERIQALANSPGTPQDPARRVLSWLRSPLAGARIPRREALSVSRALSRSGQRLTLTHMREERLAILACRPIPGFELLKGNPAIKGFPFALASRSATFDARETRLVMGPTNALPTSPEAS